MLPVPRTSRRPQEELLQHSVRVMSGEPAEGQCSPARLQHLEYRSQSTCSTTTRGCRGPPGAPAVWRSGGALPEGRALHTYRGGRWLQHRRKEGFMSTLRPDIARYIRHPSTLPPRPPTLAELCTRQEGCVAHRWHRPSVDPQLHFIPTRLALDEVAVGIELLHLLIRLLRPHAPHPHVAHYTCTHQHR